MNRAALLQVLTDAFEAAGERVDFSAWDFDQLVRVLNNPNELFGLVLSLKDIGVIGSAAERAEPGHEEGAALRAVLGPREVQEQANAAEEEAYDPRRSWAYASAARLIVNMERVRNELAPGADPYSAIAGMSGLDRQTVKELAFGSTYGERNAMGALRRVLDTSAREALEDAEGNSLRPLGAWFSLGLRASAPEINAATSAALDQIAEREGLRRYPRQEGYNGLIQAEPQPETDAQLRERIFNARRRPEFRSVVD